MNANQFLQLAKQVKANHELNSACYDQANLDDIKRLIQEGADINNDDGTPLFTAFILRYKDIIEFLIEEGVDLHSPRISKFIDGIKNNGAISLEMREMIDLILKAREDRRNRIKSSNKRGNQSEKIDSK